MESMLLIKKQEGREKLRNRNKRIIIVIFIAIQLILLVIILRALTHLSFIAPLWNRYCYYHYYHANFTDEETEVEKAEELPKDS